MTDTPSCSNDQVNGMSFEEKDTWLFENYNINSCSVVDAEEPYVVHNAALTFQAPVTIGKSA